MADGAAPNHPRDPRDLPNHPSHLHPVIPRLSTNTSMYLNTCLGVDGMTPRLASRVRDLANLVRAPVDGVEVASLERDLTVDGEVRVDPASLARDPAEAANPARAVEEDGADGENTSGRVMVTLNMATNRARLLAVELV